MQRGFNDPPLLLRLFGLYELLCNNCGLEFRGFAVPGTVKRTRGVRIEVPHRATAGNRRRAPRTNVRLPVKVLVYGSETTFGNVQLSPILVGFTRDLSEIGMSSVFPAARFSDRELTGDYRRLRISLQLPPGPVQIYATAVRYELLDESEGDRGWLIGARITKMSPDDRRRLVSYLAKLKA